MVKARRGTRREKTAPGRAKQEKQELVERKEEDGRCAGWRKRRLRKGRRDDEEEGRFGSDEVMGRVKEGGGGVRGEGVKELWWEMCVEEEGEGWQEGRRRREEEGETMEERRKRGLEEREERIRRERR